MPQGITENPIKTLIRLNIERNRSENLGAFAPDYVNVLTLNLDLIDQYPEAYGEFLELHNGGNCKYYYKFFAQSIPMRSIMLSDPVYFQLGG
jgi:hypothetical protein